MTDKQSLSLFGSTDQRTLRDTFLCLLNDERQSENRWNRRGMRIGLVGASDVNDKIYQDVYVAAFVAAGCNGGKPDIVKIASRVRGVVLAARFALPAMPHVVARS